MSRVAGCITVSPTSSGSMQPVGLSAPSLMTGDSFWPNAVAIWAPGPAAMMSRTVTPFSQRIAESVLDGKTSSGRRATVWRNVPARRSAGNGAS